jgi:hypothetical protein
MESVGVCLRCGNYVCETCRTRWRGQILCADCINRALLTREAAPGQLGEQRREALVALTFGVAAWLLAGLALFVLDRFDQASARAGVIASFVVFLIVAGNTLLAGVGVGHALAALRGGGPFRMLALIGLVVSGLYVGVVLGLGTIGLWQN